MNKPLSKYEMEAAEILASLNTVYRTSHVSNNRTNQEREVAAILTELNRWHNPSKKYNIIKCRTL